MKKKGRKRINLAEHDPSERVLFARANIRGRNSEPPWIPSVPTFSLLSSFHSYPFTLFSPLPSLLRPRKRNLVLDRDSCAPSSDAILVTRFYRVWLGRGTRLACPDVRQLKQADVHDIAQSVIRIG